MDCHQLLIGSKKRRRNFPKQSSFKGWPCKLRPIEELAASRNPLRRNRDFLPQFQLDHPCPALRTKIFLFHFSEIHVSLPASCFPWRGGSRSSRTLEAGCGGREGVQRACARRRKQLHGRRRRVV